MFFLLVDASVPAALFSLGTHHSAGGSSKPKEGDFGGEMVVPDVPLTLREKSLVPGQSMRAGLLTEDPLLEEDSIVCGRWTLQRKSLPLNYVSYRALSCALCLPNIRYCRRTHIVQPHYYV